MQEMPDVTREQLLQSISQTIVNFMAPFPSRSSEPLEELEPRDQVCSAGARVPQPYSVIGGTREDFRPLSTAARTRTAGPGV